MMRLTTAMCPSSLPGVPLLVLFLLLGAQPAIWAQQFNNNTQKCDPAKPSAYNCLTSCKRPCTTEKCRYKCHLNTAIEIFKLAVTPPEGASMSAFNRSAGKMTLFLTDDIVFRIDPLGTYKGPMEVADYIATFVHPYGLGSRTSLRSVEVVNYVHTGQVAALTVVLPFYFNDDPTQRTTNLTLSAYFAFDPITQKLAKGDCNFLRFPEFQEELNKPGPRVSDSLSADIIKAVCGVDAMICRPLGYAGYHNETDCATFVSSLPRIAPHGVQGNNQYCRFVHVAYATVDPKLHCPHLSRSGGGVCVDQVYTDYYKLFAPGSFVGMLPQF